MYTAIWIGMTMVQWNISERLSDNKKTLAGVWRTVVFCKISSVNMLPISPRVITGTPTIRAITWRNIGNSEATDISEICSLHKTRNFGPNGDAMVKFEQLLSRSGIIPPGICMLLKRNTGLAHGCALSHYVKDDNENKIDNIYCFHVFMNTRVLLSHVGKRDFDEMHKFAYRQPIWSVPRITVQSSAR